MGGSAAGFHAGLGSRRQVEQLRRPCLTAPSGWLGLRGHIYIADSGNNRIRRIEGGKAGPSPGTGSRGSSGSGGPATAAGALRVRVVLAVDALDGGPGCGHGQQPGGAGVVQATVRRHGGRPPLADRPSPRPWMRRRVWPSALRNSCMSPTPRTIASGSSPVAGRRSGCWRGRSPRAGSGGSEDLERSAARSPSGSSWRRDRGRRPGSTGSGAVNCLGMPSAPGPRLPWPAPPRRRLGSSSTDDEPYPCPATWPLRNQRGHVRLVSRSRLVLRCTVAGLPGGAAGGRRACHGTTRRAPRFPQRRPPSPPAGSIGSGAINNRILDSVSACNWYFPPPGPPGRPVPVQVGRTGAVPPARGRGGEPHRHRRHGCGLRLGCYPRRAAPRPPTSSLRSWIKVGPYSQSAIVRVGTMQLYDHVASSASLTTWIAGLENESVVLRVNRATPR